MKNIVFINASPKLGEDSISKQLNERASTQINAAEKTIVDVRKSISLGRMQADFEALAKADALVIAFPLYFFCAPAVLMRFLEDYARFLSQKATTSKPKVYAIVNCGFPEPDINLEAVRVVRSFCRHIGADFRCGILIGAGGMLLEAPDAPPVKKALLELDRAFCAIEQDMQSAYPTAMENVSITIKFPKRLYHLMGGMGWVMQARKNGLKKRDLYRRPYEANA